MDKLIDELEAAIWRKSTLSGPDGGNCVEVAKFSDGRRGIRDSKNPTGAALIFSFEGWKKFIEITKSRELT
ncbi:DUF397 domain-containing protein [Streptosporangium sandarakinum]